MSRWVNIALQISALLTASGNNFTEMVPQAYRASVNLGILLVSGIVGIIAHSYAPDGTKVSDLQKTESK